MRDAFGGLVNIVIIVVFMVIVSGYLAFNVNYTKAFRVKNKIVSAYEQYEGNCTSTSGPCLNDIKDYMKEIGYSTTSELKIKDYTCLDGYGFCYKKVDSNNTSDSHNEGNKKCYYKIVTQIKIDIPIINKVMEGMSVFQVTGDTKAMNCSK